jgi:hypothetical protein
MRVHGDGIDASRAMGQPDVQAQELLNLAVSD